MKSELTKLLALASVLIGGSPYDQLDMNELVEPNNRAHRRHSNYDKYERSKYKRPRKGDKPHQW
jgi:hypothetical protein